LNHSGKPPLLQFSTSLLRKAQRILLLLLELECQISKVRFSASDNTNNTSEAVPSFAILTSSPSSHWSLHANP
jgi:hypothetical protein